MDVRRWRVGELAAATGLTVRALHHFDEIGLLRPAGRTTTGHRLYTEADLRALHRIVTLRHLGIPLSDIASSLRGHGPDLAGLVRRQRERAERVIAGQHVLHERLDAVLRAIGDGGEPTVDQLIEIMEALMDDQAFSAEEKAGFRERHGAHGEVMAGWAQRGAELDEEVRGLAAAGVDPAADDAQRLGRRWAALMSELSGGDRTVLSSIYARLDRKGAEQATKGAVSTEGWSYLRRVLAVGYGA